MGLARARERGDPADRRTLRDRARHQGRGPRNPDALQPKLLAARSARLTLGAPPTFPPRTRPRGRYRVGTAGCPAAPPTEPYLCCSHTALRDAAFRGCPLTFGLCGRSPGAGASHSGPCRASGFADVRLASLCERPPQRRPVSAGCRTPRPSSEQRELSKEGFDGGGGVSHASTVAGRANLSLSCAFGTSRLGIAGKPAPVLFEVAPGEPGVFPAVAKDSPSCPSC